MEIIKKENHLSYTQCLLLIDVFFNGKDNLYQEINNDHNRIQFYKQNGLFDNYCIKNDIINYFFKKDNHSKDRIFEESQKLLDTIFDSFGGFSPYFKEVIVVLYKQLEKFLKYNKKECSDEQLMQMIQKMYFVSDISQQVAKERLDFLPLNHDKKYSDIKALKQELQKFIF